MIYFVRLQTATLVKYTATSDSWF